MEFRLDLVQYVQCIERVDSGISECYPRIERARVQSSLIFHDRSDTTFQFLPFHDEIIAMTDQIDRKRFATYGVAWGLVCAVALATIREEPAEELHHDTARASAARLLRESGNDLERHVLITSARSDREGEGWVMLFNPPGATGLDEAWVVRLDRDANQILSIERPERIDE